VKAVSDTRPDALPPGLGEDVVTALRKGDLVQARRMVEAAMMTSEAAPALDWLAAYLDAVMAGDSAQARRIAESGFPGAVHADDPLRSTLAVFASDLSPPSPRGAAVRHLDDHDSPAHKPAQPHRIAHSAEKTAKPASDSAHRDRGQGIDEFLKHQTEPPQPNSEVERLELPRPQILDDTP
jgi:hypothetical protein